jgi:hypothetical protein
MKRLTFLALAITLLSSGYAVAASWQSANGRPCDKVCSSAVSSGTYKNPDARLNGQTFFVCRGNAGGEGSRAGYNLRPNWAAACWVGHGGSEVAVNSYSCLCN